MADNYLEKRMIEYQEQKAASTRLKVVNIDSLLKRNSECREFDLSYKVREDQMQRIISSLDLENINCTIALEDRAQLISESVEDKQQVANAYLIVSSSVRNEFFLGMAVQLIMLKASEIGLCGKYAKEYSSEKLSAVLDGNDSLNILIAIGKAKIF